MATLVLPRVGINEPPTHIPPTTPVETIGHSSSSSSLAPPGRATSSPSRAVQVLPSAYDIDTTHRPRRGGGPSRLLAPPAPATGPLGVRVAHARMEDVVGVVGVAGRDGPEVGRRAATVAAGAGEGGDARSGIDYVPPRAEGSTVVVVVVASVGRRHDIVRPPLPPPPPPPPPLAAVVVVVVVGPWSRNSSRPSLSPSGIGSPRSMSSRLRRCSRARAGSSGIVRSADRRHRVRTAADGGPLSDSRCRTTASWPPPLRRAGGGGGQDA